MQRKRFPTEMDSDHIIAPEVYVSRLKGYIQTPRSKVMTFSFEAPALEMITYSTKGVGEQVMSN